MKRKIIDSTPFGPIGLVWTAAGDGPKVVRVLLSRSKSSAERELAALFPDATPASCAEIEETAAAIEGILEGERIEIPLDVADLGRCGEFQRLVLRAEHRIPRGRVSTYKLIGEYLGRRNGARAVGNALARNPFPLIVPCHRVVRSDGRLGGYQGGVAMKRALLEMEGLTFDRAGRVVCSDFHYSWANSSADPVAGSKENRSKLRRRMS